ncbi:MAG: helix-turn-helix transcriptional regulator [Hydrogenophaga sp.]|nr:helix-turn-helix transcriptional regulator [Hydrogenophaga sp.]
MPGTSEITSAADLLLLLGLGARLKRERLRQGLTTVQMAEKAGLSRMTLRSVEAGEPMPTIGSYLRVMRVLGISQDLALLVSDPEPAQGRKKKQAPGAQRAVVSVSHKRHELQDFQSLVLHQEAVRLVKQAPALVQRSIDTLNRWRATGSPHSQALWEEWSAILHRRAWRRALAHTGRAQQLRQASPLTILLPEETRRRILAEVQSLKS